MLQLCSQSDSALTEAPGPTQLAFICAYTLLTVTVPVALSAVLPQQMCALHVFALPAL